MEISSAGKSPAAIKVPAEFQLDSHRKEVNIILFAPAQNVFLEDLV